MLFNAQIASLLVTTPPDRHRHTSAAPRPRRRLLSGLRLPHRARGAAAAGPLLTAVDCPGAARTR
jgi:hypothetical protein